MSGKPSADAPSRGIVFETATSDAAIEIPIVQWSEGEYMFRVDINAPPDMEFYLEPDLLKRKRRMRA